MGLLKLTDKYSEALLETACKKALSYTDNGPFYASGFNDFQQLTGLLRSYRSQQKFIQNQQFNLLVCFDYLLESTIYMGYNKRIQENRQANISYFDEVAAGRDVNFNSS